MPFARASGVGSVGTPAHCARIAASSASVTQDSKGARVGFRSQAVGCTAGICLVRRALSCSLRDAPADFTPVPFADAPPAYIAPAPAAALATCNGETITRIDIYRFAPAPRGVRAQERAANDPAARGQLRDSDPAVIRAYLRLREGAPCLEQNREDSERMLRLQRFIASAAITPVPDGPGKVRIRVDVVEEFSLVLGGGTAGLQLDEVRLGTLDFLGRGTTLIGSLKRGGAYRAGIGAQYAQPGFLGRPASIAVAGAFEPLGGNARISVVRPLLAEGQANAFLVQLATEERYDPMYRDALETASARVQRSAYQIGLMHRIGRPGRGVIGLAGVAALGSYVEVDTALVFVTDSGLSAVNDGALSGRYGVDQRHHVAAVLGVRALRFRRAERFDALRAEQDIAQGMETVLLFGPSVQGNRDDLMAMGLYLGAGSTRSFVSLQGRVEGRVQDAARNGAPDGAWRFGVGHVHLTWHSLPTDRRTRTLTLQGSVLGGHPLPMQLTMRDGEGGLLAHLGSTRAGGGRVVARLEDRWLLTSPRAPMDLAVGTFADAGRLWAGDVPFGVDSPVMASAGISILAAYPSGGKRTFRVDIGVPFARGPGDKGVAIRFTAYDRGSSRQREPRDVRRSRFETGPATAIRW